jgi:uncharacterized membrane protein YhaH (DUF805 family)
MILFILPVLALIAIVIAGIVFAAAFNFIRKPSTAKNRFGSSSSTLNIFSAIVGAMTSSFDFSGRSSRLDFWSFCFFVIIMCASGYSISIYIIITDAAIGVIPVLLLTSVPALLFAMPSLSIAVRRLHDVNRSGWWILLLLVFGYFILLYWFVQPSQSDDATVRVFE